MRKSLAISIALISVLGTVKGSIAGQPEIMRCRDVTLANPGIGVPYRGAIANSDYRFVASIPKGLTGWGGVAEGSPFHGFTIFLDSKLESCLVFDIHLRVDEADAPERAADAALLSMGAAQAWTTTNAQMGMTNIRTSFSSQQTKHFNDGQILLIAPTAALKKAKKTYESFLNSVKFEP